MHPLAEKYLRKSALPTIFCPGCGHGTVLNAFLRVIDDLDNIDRLGLVSGIGCSSWTPVFINTDVLHTLHGRALAFATGLKISNSKLDVVVFTGDGDCIGIGGNHLIHAARRNIDITVLMLDNNIYGMTGGQVSPTTPTHARSQTTPFGNPEPQFDACAVVASSGATHVARYTTAKPRVLVKGIRSAIQHKGFSFVHILSQCPTQAGRYIYAMTQATEYLKLIREQSITTASAAKLSREDLKGRIVTGILHESDDSPEFLQSLSHVGGS
jgi:2-oxoglutarate ferredoxin oxidoreductase subunit beta